MVCVLDGFSFIFSNTFMWFGEDIKKLLKMPSTRRGMMYIDVDPITPEVLHAMFCRGLFFQGRVRKYIWQHVTANWKVINLPIELPTIYFGVPRPADWVNFFTPKKEAFRQVVEKYHKFVLNNGNADVLIVWYPIPDQAHHHFFPAITSHELLEEAVKWYNISARMALELIERFKPQRFLIVGDHSFVSDIESIKILGMVEAYHHREALALTNFGNPPRRPAEVYEWLRRAISSQ